MTYFRDLTQYVYATDERRPSTVNVGWLSPEHRYTCGKVDEVVFERLWNFCKVSVAQSRGGHICEFCSDHKYGVTDRGGEKLLLGTSEIRIFGGNGVIYAAPTLIYHYMSKHNYLPPNEFIEALRNCPIPPDPRYFSLLDDLSLKWNLTTAPGDDIKPISFRGNCGAKQPKG